jgi:DNA-binding CsgD family transcriptional regulator
MNKITNHPILNHAQDVAEICKPLKLLNIDYFSHVRVDNKGHFTALASNAGFAEHYLNNKYYNADIHMAVNYHAGNYVIWDAIERDGLSERMHQEASAFGIEHTFTLIDKNRHGSDFYHFAGNAIGSSINQIYLENIDLLELFVLFFNEKVFESKALSSVYQHTFSIDADAPGYMVKDNVGDLRDSLASFREEIKLKKKLRTGKIHALSRREVEILDWLHHGKTTEQIAQILEVSNVTINKHIANIKEKTGCFTQFQLGELYNSVLNHADGKLSQIFKK